MVHFSTHGGGIRFQFLENSAKFKALFLAVQIYNITSNICVFPLLLMFINTIITLLYFSHSGRRRTNNSL